MRQDIENSVIKLIAKQKSLNPSDITSESTLEALGVTSLEAITIVYDIEEKFDVEVPDEILDKLDTVHDIVDGVASLISEKE